MNTSCTKELSRLLEILGEQLDITPTEYEAAVKSYEAVGDWLSKPESGISKFKPEIWPQGSFMLGTMTRPVNDYDDLDIDLICRLSYKPVHWTQYHLKEAIGNRLKEHQKYRSMLESMEGGRRCWTLEYKMDKGYHMDILPAIIGEDFQMMLDRPLGSIGVSEMDNLAIRITDRDRADFKTEIDLKEWNKSNPFGYARWFFGIALIDAKRLVALKEAVHPVREFETEKLPLQRIVQILKRHRDIMFRDDSGYDLEHKPISIIITTLATRAYDKEEDVFDGLGNVVARMRGMIEDRWNGEKNIYEKWVANPVNGEENYADRWPEEDLKKKYFYEWLDKLEEDMASLINSGGRGLYKLQESFSAQFGDKLTSNVFRAYGDNNRSQTESGVRRMAAGTGILGGEGIPLKKHNFEGTDEE